MTEKIRDDVDDVKLKVLVNDLKAPDFHLILSAKNTGLWLNIWVIAVTGAVLAAMYFRGFFCAHYDFTPPNLQKKSTSVISTYP